MPLQRWLLFFCLVRRLLGACCIPSRFTEVGAGGGGPLLLAELCPRLPGGIPPFGGTAVHAPAHRAPRLGGFMLQSLLGGPGKLLSSVLINQV